MSASIQGRRRGALISGAGLVCLAAAGSISVSGCTTPSTADLNAPAKKTQQVAKSKSSSTAKKAPPTLAVKDPSGKARISDVNDATKSPMVAQKTPPKADASNRPVAQVRRDKTQLASASIDPQAPAAGRSRVTKEDANAVATKQQKPAATQKSAARVASTELADVSRSESGSIKQTAANGTSKSAARRRTREVKPPTEQQPPAAEVDVPVLPPPSVNSESVLASSHERRRADRLMQKAHDSYSSGYPEEALRLASVAVELERSGQAHYRRGEERPSDYITWLQSIAVSRNTSPPVIRPQASPGQQQASVAETGTSIAAVGAETSDPRRAGEVIRANAGTNSSLSADIAADASNVTRSNTGVDLAAPEAPQFATLDKPISKAGANVGQMEVPVPPQPRSADATVALANNAGSSFDAPAVPEAGPTESSSNRLQNKAAKAPSLQIAARDKSAEMSTVAEDAVDDVPAEADAFAEGESSNLMPARTSQLTSASLVGLITGVAGMFGLSWWRRQERRHYAEGK